MSPWSACRPSNGARRRSASSSAAKAEGVGEAELLQWFNQRIGKTQRLAALHFIAELPRSAIGKVLKRELRELHRVAPAAR